jgi:hypothetical protein
MYNAAGTGLHIVVCFTAIILNHAVTNFSPEAFWPENRPDILSDELRSMLQKNEKMAACGSTLPTIV